MAGRRSFAYQAVIAVVAVGLALPVEEARAGGGDALAGGIIGFAAGMMVGRATARPAPRRVYVRERPARPARPVAPKAAAVSRADVVLIQKSLTMLGVYSGPIDGSMGPGTRAAVVRLQDKMGWPSTGVLTLGQRVAVIQVYKDAIASAGGRAPTPASSSASADQLFAAIGRATALGSASETPPIIPVAAIAGGAAAIGTVAAAPSLAAAVAPPVVALPALSTPAAPAGAGAAQICANVRTASGDVTSEFCAVRAAALVAAAEALATMPSVDASMLAEGCSRTAASLTPQVATLQTASADSLAAGLRAGYAVLGEADRAGASTRFKICVGVGLTHDDPAVALASSLAATSLDQAGYAEIVAGSLALGVGTTRNDRAAAGWYGYAADAYDRGGSPIATTAAAPARAAVSRNLATSLGAPDRLILARADAATTLQAAPVTDQGAARAEAESFFAVQQVSAAGQMETLSVALGMSKDDVTRTCEAKADPRAAPGEPMTVRLCRAWAYAVGRKPAMHRFDKALADAGDADAQARLPKHVALGHGGI